MPGRTGRLHFSGSTGLESWSAEAAPALAGWFTVAEIDEEDAVIVGMNGDPTFWRVRPLGPTWEEMTGHPPLPVTFRGALLPWKDSVMGDSVAFLLPETPLRPEQQRELGKGERNHPHWISASGGASACAEEAADWPEEEAAGIQRQTKENRQGGIQHESG